MYSKLLPVDGALYTIATSEPVNTVEEAAMQKHHISTSHDQTLVLERT